MDACPFFLYLDHRQLLSDTGRCCVRNRLGVVRRKKYITLIALGIFLIWAGSAVAIYKWVGHDDRGTFGDMFGAAMRCSQVLHLPD